jgi:Fic family protein
VEHLEKQKKAELTHLKSFATISSVGASTRIEGSKLSDDEIEKLILQVGIGKIEDRDTQEVMGYYDCLELLHSDFQNIEIREGDIKNLHKIMLKYSQKDQWHLGNYKQHSNAVEVKFPDGTNQIIFQPTEPGYKTEEAMKSLVSWYKEEKEVHPIIKSSLLAYEFLSIHPFQDGNGRLSRLLTNLALLKAGYQWVQYVSFEHEIENQKNKYYQELRQCQSQRPNENITSWVIFYLEALRNIQRKLKAKLEDYQPSKVYSPKETRILDVIRQIKEAKSGLIANELGMPLPTIKRYLNELVKKKALVKHGKGRGTYYEID